MTNGKFLQYSSIGIHELEARSNVVLGSLALVTSKPDTSELESVVSGRPRLRASLRLERANNIVTKNTMWALSLGLVPAPLFDLVALFGVQLKLLRDLSKHYEVKFSTKLARKLITSLMTSAGGVSLGIVSTASFGKLVPVMGVVSMSLVSGATTYAMGRVFIMHFESGGTLLDFDPLTMRKHFKAEFERARREVSKLRERAQAEAEADASMTKAEAKRDHGEG